jgi:hypothetical protein
MLLEAKLRLLATLAEAIDWRHGREQVAQVDQPTHLATSDNELKHELARTARD